MESTSSTSTLLNKLATDDAFREYMLGDPAGALSSIGITVDAAQIPAVRSLPSKASLAADMDAISSKLDSNAGLFIFIVTGQA